LVTGRAFPVGEKVYVVAKVIGVETSRVYGETAKFAEEDELEDVINELSDKIIKVVEDKGTTLMAKVETGSERLERLKKLIGKKGEGKSIYCKIDEHHISRAIPDPAAQTEILLTFQQLGFEITEDKKAADIKIVGEGFSERSGQRGQLVSCRARVEIKRLDSDKKLVSVDRQTEVAVDLGENVAAKSALQKAGEILAERLVAEIAAES